MEADALLLLQGHTFVLAITKRLTFAETTAAPRHSLACLKVNLRENRQQCMGHTLAMMQQ